jgi:hypothetical protein
MLKISIVMLTTTVFAGLLIAHPYGSPSRTGMVETARLQTAPGPVQPRQTVPQPEPSHAPIATPVRPEDTPVVALGEQAPEPVNPVSQPDRRLLAAVAPMRPQPAGGLQRRAGPHKGFWLDVNGRRTATAYRLAQYRYIHTAGRTNVVHHVRHRA